ncbi:thioesterase II family protein [Sphingobacterium faecium]|uniref:thioesterase II family protein n=1 Tax=Sphingobacterium faecium TaxID=34087 RepID=UPI003207FBBE
MSIVKLFCFPYAGGSASYFSSWKSLFSSSIELCPIELKGRGRRVNESHYKDFNDLVEDVFWAIKPQITTGNYAFFGHSMGTLISHRLYHKIAESNLPLPCHLFFSGKGAPHISRDDLTIYHKLDDEIFRKEVMDLGGTSKVVFENKDLHNLFLPMLKNDFRICEENLFDLYIKPINKDITVFVGKDDDISAEEIIGWRDQTSGICNIHIFNGGHFFLNHYLKEISSIILRSVG